MTKQAGSVTVGGPGTYVVGLDLGKHGGDRTGVMVREGDRWREATTEEIARAGSFQAGLERPVHLTVAKAPAWTAATVLEALRAQAEISCIGRVLEAFGAGSPAARAYDLADAGGARHELAGATWVSDDELAAMAGALNKAGVPAPKAEPTAAELETRALIEHERAARAPKIGPTCACDPIGPIRNRADGRGEYCSTCGLDLEEHRESVRDRREGEPSGNAGGLPGAKVDPYEAHSAMLLDEAGAVMGEKEVVRLHASGIRHATRAEAVEHAERRLRNAESSAATHRYRLDIAERAAASLRAALADARAPGVRS
jgi:hypothetical protein